LTASVNEVVPAGASEAVALACTAIAVVDAFVNARDVAACEATASGCVAGLGADAWDFPIGLPGELVCGPAVRAAWATCGAEVGDLMSCYDAMLAPWGPVARELRCDLLADPLRALSLVAPFLAPRPTSCAAVDASCPGLVPGGPAGGAGGRGGAGGGVP
jgi:hypothetical protein